jgi:Tol biopolymer transport system component
MLFGGDAAGASRGVTERVSVGSAGVQANGDSYAFAISADGRYIAFDSMASNLVAADTNDASDVFVHDRQTGVTQRVSVDSAGNEGNGSSTLPAISADGRYIAFDSMASNLVAADTNDASDVFVHDRQTGVTERVSVDSAGREGDYDSLDSTISGDGRYVAFSSDASNLVPGDTKTCTTWLNPRQCRDVFVHDRQTGVTQRVSVDSAGGEANGPSYDAAISGDGRYVAFSSIASNLVEGDTNGYADVFVHDRDTDGDGVLDKAGAIATTRLAMGHGHTLHPAISADGHYVAFYSELAGSMSCQPPGYGTGEGYEGCSEVFVHDRDTDGDGIFDEAAATATTPVAMGNGDSQHPAISADGRYVAFDSYASNLAAGDTRDRDAFVRDRQTGVTEQASVDSAGNQGNGESSCPAISADGRYVAFSSQASNLVQGDTNNSQDVFVHDRGAAPTTARLTVCPSAGKWAISVWDGPGGTATGDALATCADPSIDAAYWLDPTSQLWWRYFPGLLDISNLLTLGALQPIIVRGR